MKLKIGPSTNDLQILDNEGNDITKKLAVKRIAFDIDADTRRMRVSMEVFADVEIEIGPDQTITLGDEYLPHPEWAGTYRILGLTTPALPE